MADVKVWFTVYGVPDDDTGEQSKSINNLLDQLVGVDTDLTWDEVWWEVV